MLLKSVLTSVKGCPVFFSANRDFYGKLSSIATNGLLNVIDFAFRAFAS